MTNEQIEYKIRQIKAIWGIENMEMDAEFEKNARAFFDKKITEEEFERTIFEKKTYEV